MDKIKDFILWCRRYVKLLFVALVGLAVYVIFFNENSYSRLADLNRQISELRSEIKENEDTMIHYRELNRLLNSDPAEMERIARERYHMQGPNEDVFIVE